VGWGVLGADNRAPTLKKEGRMEKDIKTKSIGLSLRIQYRETADEDKRGTVGRKF